MRRRPAHDVLRAHHAGLTGDLPPTLEQGERRDAADTELRGQVGLSLGIHLRQPDPRFELVRRLLDQGELVAVGGPAVAAGRNYELISPRENRERPRFRAFSDWLRSEVALSQSAAEQPDPAD